VADEVLVADSNSTTTPLPLRKRSGARVVRVAVPAASAICANRTLEHCATSGSSASTPMSAARPEVRDEILALMSGKPSHDAYLCRGLLHDGPLDRRLGCIRTTASPQLFRKGAMRYTPDPVHEGYELLSAKPRSGICKRDPPVSVPHMEEVIRKDEPYSTLGAAKLAGSASRWPAPSATGCWAFSKHYIFKARLQDGWAGFVIAFGNFEGTFYRYAKRYEETPETGSRREREADAAQT